MSSFSRVIKSQGPLQVSTESGIVDITPAGSSINLGKAVTFSEASATRTNLGVEIGADVLAYNADLQTVADLAPGSSEDGKLLAWDNTAGAYVLAVDSTNSYTAGDGLALNAGEFSLDAAVAGDGLAHASGVLSVGVDDATVEVSGDALRVKALGINTSHLSPSAVDSSILASNSVTSAKITDLNVTSGKLADSAVSTVKLADNAVTSAKLASGLELSSPIVEQSNLLFTSANAGASHYHAQHHFTTANDTQSDQSILTLGTGDRYLVDVMVVGNDQSDGAVGCYSARFACKNDAGTASILGSSNVALEYEEANSADWSVDFGVSGADLQVQLTGDASNSVRFSVAVKAVRCN